MQIRTSEASEESGGKRRKQIAHEVGLTRERLETVVSGEKAVGTGRILVNRD